MKTKVSVGISAFNEEKNIASVIHDVLSQSPDNWILQEILVYSDGSTDNTVVNAQKVKSKILHIVANKRLGKTAQIGSMFAKMKGDIFVFFDADVKLKNKHVISSLINPLQKDNEVVLVGGNSMPFKPNNFFQRGVFATFKVFYASRISLKQGNNLFGCTGSCLAVRKSFAQSIKFPKIKNDDTFLYFTCISKGYKFKYVDNAVIYYKLPSNVFDYLKQVFRSNPEAVYQNFKKYFGDLVEREYQRNTKQYLLNVIKVLRDDPLPVMFIIFVNIMSRPFFYFISKNEKMTWDAIRSTK